MQFRVRKEPRYGLQAVSCCVKIIIRVLVDYIQKTEHIDKLHNICFFLLFILYINITGITANTFIFL